MNGPSTGCTVVGTHVVLLEEVLAQARRHEHTPGIGVSPEMSLPALAPGRRKVRVKLHCSYDDTTSSEIIGNKAQRSA